MRLPVVSVHPTNAAARNLGGVWHVVEETPETLHLTFVGVLDPAQGEKVYTVRIDRGMVPAPRCLREAQDQDC
jgi:hypothetical protein